jgi:uncharacterized membrane protein
MISDLTSIFTWWLSIFGLSLLSLPIVFRIFSKFWDKGYIFAKTISLILFTYFTLVLGVFKILPFNYLGLSALVIIFLAVDGLFLIRHRRYLDFFATIKKNFPIFLIEELIFLIILLIWSLIRGFSPDIEGLEKYMDWGFVNTALRSQFWPPIDMWFSGQTINYYYFGHLIFALITKVSQVPSSIGYNLSIATVCSLTFTSAFSLVSNITHLSLPKINYKKIVTAGLISALLLTFGGNLHSVFKITKLNYTQNNSHIVFTQAAWTKAFSSYWYPDATRFIGHDPDTNDKTIHEFPIYSFVVSDLHGHMNDIFIVIFFLAFLFAAYKTKNISHNFIATISGFILSICYMTNAWDFAVYGLVLAIFTFLINFQNNGPKSLIKTIFNGFLVIVFWYIFSYPFSLKFTPMMEGIKISDGHSPFYQLFVLYGGFWLICLPFVVKIIQLLLQKQLKKINYSHLFIFSLIVTATILIIIPELVYIKDIYIYEHRRANTMFKLVYQAFMLYSLAGGYILINSSTLFKSAFKNFYKVIFALIFVIHLIYPYFAIKSYYNDLKDYKGLDGLKYLESLYPDNYQAILWINKNISGQPVMLEAPGDSYTTFDQVSSATGLPTVQGWIVHEWLWRGGYDAPAARQKDVNTIYESTDLSEIKSLINKYKIQYIFVGAKEYEKYADLDPKKFENIGAKIIFQSGQTTIYQL